MVCQNNDCPTLVTHFICSYCLDSRWDFLGMAKEKPTKRPRQYLTTSDGRTATMAEWARLTGIDYRTIQFRHKSGWSPDEVLGFSKRESLVLQNLTASGGERHSIKEWSKITGIHISTILHRVKSGWSDDQSLGFAPSPSEIDMIEWNGRRYTLKDSAKEVGISSEAMRQRLRAGWSVDEALSTPKRCRRPNAFKHQRGDDAE